MGFPRTVNAGFTLPFSHILKSYYLITMIEVTAKEKYISGKASFSRPLHRK